MRAIQLSRIAEAGALFSLLTMLLALPLIRSGLPVFSTPSAARVLAGLFEIMFILGICNSGKFHVPHFPLKPWVRYTALLWLLWSALSLVLAEYPAAALVRQSEWYLHLLFTLTLWSYLSSEKALAGIIIKAILGGFYLYCLLFLYCWHAIHPSPHLINWVTEMPGFTNIRHFGYFAMVAVILSAYPLFMSREGKGIGFLYFVLEAFCWGALLWSGSRGSILAALFSLGFLLLFLPVLVRRRLLFHQSAAFAAGAYLCGFYSVNLRGFGLGYLAGSFDVATGSGLTSGRTDIWLETIPAVLAHPFFGIGADGFMFIPRTIQLWVFHPHNFFLQAAIDWGLPGLVLTCLLLVALLRHFSVQLCRHEGISAEKVVSIWGVTALCLLALIDGPFYHAHSLALSACLFAITLYISPARDDQSVPSMLSASLMCSLVIPLAVVLGAHLWILTAQLKEQVPEPTALVVKVAHALPTDISNSTRWARNWSVAYPAEAMRWLHWGYDHVQFRKKADFLYAESEILMRQGQWLEARAHLQEALRLSPLSKLEEKIRRQLGVIEQELTSSL